MSHAAQVNSLVTPDMKPWLLKGNFRRVDTSGKLIEEGSVTEWWLSPDERRIEVAISGATQTFVYTPGHEFHSAGADYLPDSLYILLPALTEPVNSASLKNLEPEEQGPNGSCIALSRHNTVESGYCLAREDALLSGTVIANPLFAVRRSIRVFQGHFVPASLDIADGKTTFYSLQLTALEEITASAVNLDTAHLVESPDPVPPHGAVLTWPTDSEMPDVGLLDQMVVLRVITANDGHVGRVDVLYARDDRSAEIVAKQIHKWNRHPPLFERKPIGSDEIVTIFAAKSSIAVF